MMTKKQALMIALALIIPIVATGCNSKSEKTSSANEQQLSAEMNQETTETAQQESAQRQKGEHQMPLLGIDVTGMEAVDANLSYWLDETLYIALDTYYPFANSKDYDEKSMITRIKALEPDNFKLTSIAYKEHNERVGYGTWNIVYQAGENDDIRSCSDVYFRTPFGEYRVHTALPPGAAEKYKDEVGRRLETITLFPPLTIDTTDLSALDYFGMEYSGETLDVKLQAFVSLMDNKGKIKSITKNNIQQIIDKLETPPYEAHGFVGAKEVKFSLSDKYSKQLSYPVYLVKYTMGGNEDTSFNTDLFFQTDKGYYRVNISYDPDSVEDEGNVENDINRIFSSVALDTYYTGSAVGKQ